MSQEEDDTSLNGTNKVCCLGTKSRTIIKPTKSLLVVKKHGAANRTSEYRKEQASTSSRVKEPSRNYSKIYEPSDEAKRGAETAKAAVLQTPNGERVFGESEFFVSDCWNTGGEKPNTFLELFKDGCLEDDDADVPVKKRRLDSDEDGKKSPPYTKEFHLLTEVQKARILTTVEDTIKKLVYEDHYQGSHDNEGEKSSYGLAHQTSVERFFCKKFLLPWVIIKVVEMVLCHIIQLAFLSQDSYFQRKGEFLPIVVTYYLTLFIVIISLVVHISCFSYAGIQNPCYFMGVISSSILTLTTSLGILIMLTSMEYYRSFNEILVLVFIGVLLCSLFAELCLCYVEVKKIWNRGGQFDQYYLN